VAYEQFASDLAATFYAASLIPNPTLKRWPKAAAVEAYEAKGWELAKKVLNPDRPALIRCTCGTRLNRPDRPSRAIAAVSDRSLLIVRGPRGPVYDGLRLQEHYLVDLGIRSTPRTQLPMAQTGSPQRDLHPDQAVPARPLGCPD
jgi:hypothetical protein